MKNLLFFVSLLSSVYSFGQRIRPKIRQKSPEFRHRLPERLIPIYYAIQMSSDNDDRQQRVTGMTPDMLQRFQNSFNSRNPIPTFNVPELNFPSPIPQNWTENSRDYIIDYRLLDPEYETQVIQLNEDRLTLQKINELISKNSLEEAAYEFSNLNFDNLEMKEIIQQKLNENYGSEIMVLNTNKMYVLLNKKKLKTIKQGNYSLEFDKNGKCSEIEFPDLDYVPQVSFGEFIVYKKSQAEIKIEIKDSILVSSTLSTSYTKPLFIDKKENFYYKTKTGLPVATISNDPSIDKKTVRINKVYKREKYANGILIDTQEFKTEKTVIIMKKDQ